MTTDTRRDRLAVARETRRSDDARRAKHDVLTLTALLDERRRLLDEGVTAQQADREIGRWLMERFPPRPDRVPYACENCEDTGLVTVRTPHYEKREPCRGCEAGDRWARRLRECGGRYGPCPDTKRRKAADSIDDAAKVSPPSRIWDR